LLIAPKKNAVSSLETAMEIRGKKDLTKNKTKNNINKINKNEATLSEMIVLILCFFYNINTNIFKFTVKGW